MAGKVKLLANYCPQTDSLYVMEAGTNNDLSVESDDDYDLMYCGKENADGSVDKITCVDIEGWREDCLPHAFEVISRISKKTGWVQRDIWDAILSEYLPRQNVPALWERKLQTSLRHCICKGQAGDYTGGSERIYILIETGRLCGHE